MIVLISNDTPRRDEISYASWLLEDGLDRFHLRRPNASPFDRLKETVRIPAECLPKISVHSDLSWGPVPIEGLPKLPVGFHKTAADSWDLLEGAQIKSASFHTIEEYLECPVALDYAFLSPVFASISKEGYAPTANFQQDLKKLATIKKHCPILALGGIDFDRVSEIHDLGFDGLVLKGAFWNVEEPVDVFKAIRDRWISLEGK